MLRPWSPGLPDVRVEHHISPLWAVPWLSVAICAPPLGVRLAEPVPPVPDQALFRVVGAGVPVSQVGQ